MASQWHKLSWALKSTHCIMKLCSQVFLSANEFPRALMCAHESSGVLISAYECQNVRFNDKQKCWLLKWPPVPLVFCEYLSPDFNNKTLDVLKFYMERADKKFQDFYPSPKGCREIATNKVATVLLYQKRFHLDTLVTRKIFLDKKLFQAKENIYFWLQLSLALPSPCLFCHTSIHKQA